MSVVTGFFNSAGSPCIRVSLHGAFAQAERTFDAVIDTGFTGFISMPLLEAFPLALILFGTTQVTLADGSSAVKLTAWGNARIQGEDGEKSGIIILEPSSNEVLLGMEFLKVFNKSLLIFSDSVSLVTTPEPPQAPPEGSASEKNDDAEE